MPVQKASLWLYALVFINSNILAAPRQTEPTNLENGVEFQLTRDGFKTMSETTTDFLKEKYASIHIDEHKLRLLKILGIKLSRVEITPVVNELEITPDSDKISFNLELKNLGIEIEKAEITNPFLPFARISCMNTQIHIGDQDSYRLAGDLNISLNSESNIELNAQNISGNIAPENYQAYGPETCLGFFGGRNVLLESVGRLIARSLRTFAPSVVNSLIQHNQHLASTWVNQKLSAIQNLQIPEFILTPKTHLDFKFNLSQLNLTKSGLSLRSNVTIRHKKTLDENTKPDHIDPDYREINSDIDGSANSPGLLHFLADPELINICMAKVYNDPENEFELSPSLHVRFAKLFSKEELKEIWPAIDSVQSPVKYLRAFISLGKPPRVQNAIIDEKEIELEIPDLKFRFQIHDKFGWRNFFNLKISIRSNARMEFNPLTEMEIIIKEPSMKVAGEWPEDFLPEDTTFRREEMEETLNLLIRLFVEKKSPMKLKLPRYQIHKKYFSFTNFWSSEDHFQLTIHESLAAMFN